MRLVSPLLKRAIYPALHHGGWLARVPPPGGYAVVNYHGVVPDGYSSDDDFLDGNLVRPETLHRQLQFLKAHYDVIHPEDFRAWIEQGKPLPPRAILLTCDDGLLNNLTDMLPVLQSEGVACLFFVTAASCGNNPGMLWYEELYHLMRIKPLSGSDLQLRAEAGAESAPAESFHSQWWNMLRRASRLDAGTRTDWMRRIRSHCGLPRGFRSESRCEKRWRLLNITELKQLVDAGMSVGAHTLTHPILSLCSDEEARREIQESKTALERALGKPVWAFAYPFGNPATMGEREFRLAREAGFSCAFLNVEHWGGKQTNPFALLRTHVTLDMTLPEFTAHLSGVHNRLQRAVAG
jgi:peptidoglycan/xylan/chitin deacetylase (PgdA/CDA1 family)